MRRLKREMRDTIYSRKLGSSETTKVQCAVCGLRSYYTVLLLLLFIIILLSSTYNINILVRADAEINLSSHILSLKNCHIISSTSQIDTNVRFLSARRRVDRPDMPITIPIKYIYICIMFVSYIHVRGKPTGNKKCRSITKSIGATILYRISMYTSCRRA